MSTAKKSVKKPDLSALTALSAQLTERAQLVEAEFQTAVETIRRHLPEGQPGVVITRDKVTGLLDVQSAINEAVRMIT